jgi:hypothetical protein
MQREDPGGSVQELQAERIVKVRAGDVQEVIPGVFDPLKTVQGIGVPRQRSGDFRGPDFDSPAVRDDNRQRAPLIPDTAPVVNPFLLFAREFVERTV